MFPALLFEDAHVRLEPLELRHVPALTAAASGARDTYAYTWVPDGEAAMLRYVEEALALRESGAAVPFATVQPGTGRVIGSTRFFNFEYFRWPAGARAPPQPPDAVEIGWTWLSAGAQRTAVNTEAKRPIAKIFSRTLNVGSPTPPVATRTSNTTSSMAPGGRGRITSRRSSAG